MVRRPLDRSLRMYGRGRKVGRSERFLTLTKHFLLLIFKICAFSCKGARPNSNWSYYQALKTYIWRILRDIHAQRDLCFHMNITTAVQEDRCIQLQPMNHAYYGPHVDLHIQPQSVNGIWYPSKPQTTPTTCKKGGEQLAPKPIVLHFHGGPLVSLGSSEANVSKGAQAIARQLPGTIVFMPLYRISLDYDGHYPAAVQDAITAYHRVQALYPDHPIVISGESFGGHVALTLLRLLSPFNVTEVSPQPAATAPIPIATLLFSPLVDLPLYSNANAVKANRNSSADFLGGAALPWLAGVYLPIRMCSGDDERDTLADLCPASRPFRTPVPVWVSVGSAEVLNDSVVDFVDQMRSACVENDVHLMEVANAPHDILAMAEHLGWEKERHTMVLDAGNFVDTVRVRRALEQRRRLMQRPGQELDEQNLFGRAF